MGGTSLKLTPMNVKSMTGTDSVEQSAMVPLPESLELVSFTAVSTI